MRIASPLFVVTALALGCGGAADEDRATISEPEVQAIGSTSGSDSNQQGATIAEAPSPPPPRGFVAGALGSDREHPVPRCGAMESYLFVAGKFQCPGGGNPLGGDPRAGARSRLGNVGAHAHGPERDPILDAHIVDLYEVPCPGGPQQVFVCLYHCPPGRTPLD